MGSFGAPGLVLLGYLAGGSWRQVEKLAGEASRVLLGAVVVVGVTLAAACWVARHPDRVRAAARRQLARPRVARPRVARLVSRYQAQLDFLAARFRLEGRLGYH